MAKTCFNMLVEHLKLSVEVLGKCASLGMTVRLSRGNGRWKAKLMTQQAVSTRLQLPGTHSKWPTRVMQTRRRLGLVPLNGQLLARMMTVSENLIYDEECQGAVSTFCQQSRSRDLQCLQSLLSNKGDLQQPAKKAWLKSQRRIGCARYT